MHTKTKVLLIGLCCFFSFRFESGAAVRQVHFSWIGDGGYSAAIIMRYDDAFPFVSALGGGPFGGTATNQGIKELSVLFRGPARTLLFYPRCISNSVVTYRFLKIGFNTTSERLVGNLDVGKDSFAEGEPGSPVGQFYLLSSPASRPKLMDPSTGQPVDTGGTLWWQDPN